MLTRLQSEAHVWIESCPHDAAPMSIDSLSSSERRRVDRIRHPDALRHFVAGRRLLRRVLSRYAPIDPGEWVIEETELGRPELSGPAHAPPLRFNLTHSGDLVACLVTATLDCGTDLETLDRSIDALRIARHSFHPDEVEKLSRLDEGDERRELFFSLWTLKEAYLKGRGSGIRLRLDSASFEIESAGTLYARYRERAEEAAGWRFTLLEPAPRHRLATAIRNGPSDLPVRALTLDEQGEPRPFPVRLLASG